MKVIPLSELLSALVPDRVPEFAEREHFVVFPLRYCTELARYLSLEAQSLYVFVRAHARRGTRANPENWVCWRTTDALIAETRLGFFEVSEAIRELVEADLIAHEAIESGDRVIQKFQVLTLPRTRSIAINGDQR